MVGWPIVIQEVISLPDSIGAGEPISWRFRALHDPNFTPPLPPAVPPTKHPLIEMNVYITEPNTGSWGHYLVTDPLANGTMVIEDTTTGTSNLFTYNAIDFTLADGTTRTFTNPNAALNFTTTSTIPFLVTRVSPSQSGSTSLKFVVTARTSFHTASLTKHVTVRNEYSGAMDLLKTLMLRSQPYINMLKGTIPEGSPSIPNQDNSSEKTGNEDLVIVDNGQPIKSELDKPKFNLDEQIVDNPSERRDNLNSIIDGLENAPDGMSIVDLIREKVKEPIKPEGDCDEDCWCDPSLGIDEIRRRTKK